MDDSPLATPAQASGPPRKLRAGVTLRQSSETGTLHDETTGLCLTLGSDALETLRNLPGLPEGVEPSDVEDFLSSLEQLLLFEPAALTDAAHAQGRYILQQAHAAERDRVRATVLRAASTTALHRERLRERLDGPWELTDLPTLHRADLRAHFPRGLVSDEVDLAALLRSRDLVVASTSGSSGERLQVYSDTRVPRLPLNWRKLWKLEDVGRERPLRTAVLTSPTCAGSTCSSRLDRSDRTSFDHTLFLPVPRNPFQMSASEIRAIIAELQELEADVWLVNPVYLGALAQSAEALGCTLPPAKAILHSYQFLSHCQRRQLARFFDAPLFSLYAATELGGSQIGIGCAEGNLHARLDQTFMEILRDTRPVQSSELGIVTVTSHHPCLPLVRYVVGDLARARLAPCRCDVGSAWPSYVLEGRERDAFRVQGNWITTKAIDDALSDVALSIYKLRETAPGKYRLEAIPERDTANWQSKATERLRELLSPTQLETETVKEIAIDESLKYRFTQPLPRAPCEG